jgi:hypothetical protein
MINVARGAIDEKVVNKKWRTHSRDVFHQSEAPGKLRTLSDAMTFARNGNAHDKNHRSRILSLAS